MLTLFFIFSPIKLFGNLANVKRVRLWEVFADLVQSFDWNWSSALSHRCNKRRAKVINGSNNLFVELCDNRFVYEHIF